MKASDGGVLESGIGERGRDESLAVHSMAAGAFLSEQRGSAGGIPTRRSGRQWDGGRGSAEISYQRGDFRVAQAPGLRSPAGHSRAGPSLRDVPGQRSSSIVRIRAALRMPGMKRANFLSQRL